MSTETSPENLKHTHESTPEKPGHFPVFQQLSVALGILLLIFGSTYLDDVTSLLAEDRHEGGQKADLPLREEIQKVTKDDYFTDVVISAESAFVWDVVEQKALYNKNADEQLPLASLTKLMTALVAYELADENDVVNISIDAILEDGDNGLSQGETFSFKDLTDFTLISSSNDGAHALAAGAVGTLFDGDGDTDLFVEAMNIRAEEIGLSQTYFRNVTGLDLSETEAGAFGSARDMTFLLEYILTHYPELLALTTAEQKIIENQNGEWHLAENTNGIVNEIQGLRASKTGYTTLAGGNLIIAYDAGLNRPVIITALGSSYQGRFDDVKELAERARLQILNN